MPVGYSYTEEQVKGQIAFEEHMAIPETIEQTRSFAGDSAVGRSIRVRYSTSVTSDWRRWTRPESITRSCHSDSVIDAR